MSRTGEKEGLFILPEGSGQPEQVKVRARTIHNVQTGRGSWPERLAGGKYNYFNNSIAEAPEFEPKETGLVDIMLVEFPEGNEKGEPMTSDDVVAWLEEKKKLNPEEYGGYELARPEHLDDLNANQRFTEMAKEESIYAVALGVSSSVRGWRVVARLDAWEGGERELALDSWAGQWDRRSSFVLVRKAGA